MAKDQLTDLIRKRAEQIRDSADTAQASHYLKHQLRCLQDTIDYFSKSIQMINTMGGYYPNHRREFLPLFLLIPKDIQARVYPCLLNAQLWCGDARLTVAKYRQAEKHYISGIKLGCSRRQTVTARFKNCAKQFKVYANGVEHIAIEIYQGIISSKKGGGSSAAAINTI